MTKEQKINFIKEWENVVKSLKQSQRELLKKQDSSKDEYIRIKGDIINRFHFKKDEISVFIKEWDKVITALKRSRYDLSKIKLTEEVN